MFLLSFYKFTLFWSNKKKKKLEVDIIIHTCAEVWEEGD